MFIPTAENVVVHRKEKLMIFLTILLRLLLSKPKSPIIVLTESEEESKIPRALIDNLQMDTTIAIIKIPYKRLILSSLTIAMFFYIGFKSYSKFKEIECCQGKLRQNLAEGSRQ